MNGGVGPHSGEQLISRDVLDTVMMGRTVEDGAAAYPELSPLVYGAGFERWSYQGHEIVQHGGGARGISTMLMLLPNDGVGIVALCNGNNQHPALLSLMFRIIEDSYSLKRVDWIARWTGEEALRLNMILSKPLAHPTGPQPEVLPQSELVPPFASQIVPLSALAGTYANPGYDGPLTFCSYPSAAETPCAAVLDDFALVDPDFEAEKHRALYARWPRFVATHLKLLRRENSPNGLLFDLDTLLFYPEGSGADRSPFYYRNLPGTDRPGGSLAEFGTEGLGGEVRGLGVWGFAAGPRERVPGSPEGSSEVWFTRVA